MEKTKPGPMKSPGFTVFIAIFFNSGKQRLFLKPFPRSRRLSAVEEAAYQCLHLLYVLVGLGDKVRIVEILE